MIQHVVRAGIASAAQLAAGTTRLPIGFGFSVQTAPGIPVPELARAGRFPNRRISVTTVSTLEGACFAVIWPTPGAGAYHGTVLVPYPATEDDFETLSALFVTRDNPHVVLKR